MVCRQCGTEIAEKAIICYKCGTATQVSLRPAAVGQSGRRSTVPPWGWAVLLVAMAGAMAWWRFAKG